MLVSTLDWPESALMSAYMDGLSPKIQNQLLKLEKITINDLSAIIRVALQFERKVNEYDKRNGSRNSILQNTLGWRTDRTIQNKLLSPN